MTDKLKAFMMYLDPSDPEDKKIINFLSPKIKRRKVSSALRDATLFYLRHSRRLQSSIEADIPDDSNQSSLAAELKPTAVSTEAARTFLKGKR